MQRSDVPFDCCVGRHTNPVVTQSASLQHTAVQYPVVPEVMLHRLLKQSVLDEQVAPTFPVGGFPAGVSCWTASHTGTTGEPAAGVGDVDVSGG